MTHQLDIFDLPKQADILTFDGYAYVEILDQKRLSTQYFRIFNLMKDKKWRTLSEIEDELGYPQASISAQLRHMKKKRNNSNTVNKRRRGEAKNGLFEYCLIVNENR